MKKIQNYVAIAALTTLLTACFGDKAETPAVIENTEITATTVTEELAVAENKIIPHAPTYKVGVIPDFEPYAFRGDERGLTGFNIDLTNAVAAAQGFNIQYLEKKWSPTFDSVQNSKVDFIASIVTITPERDAMIDFSASYIESSVDAAVKSELKGYSFQQLLSDKSLKYGAMANTRFADYAIKLGIAPEMLTSSLSSYTSIGDVLNGNVDAALADGQTLKYFKHQYPDISIVKNPNDIAQYAYVVKTGNTEMQQVLNAGIQKVRANGEYDKIYHKWFGK